MSNIEKFFYEIGPDIWKWVSVIYTIVILIIIARTFYKDIKNKQPIKEILMNLFHGIVEIGLIVPVNICLSYILHFEINVGVYAKKVSYGYIVCLIGWMIITNFLKVEPKHSTD